LEKGLVIKSSGSRYKVLNSEGEVIDCSLKGKFRIQDIRTTNPLAVGDNVLFEYGKGKDSNVISELLERRNYIIRRASNLSKQYQILAANIDQAFLMATIVSPETPVEFIDRFLATAEAYRINAKIIFNKTDLYNKKDQEKMEYLVSLYQKIGYKCFSLSVKNKENITQLLDVLKNKTSLIAGNSGVGKTSLLNLIDPSLKLKVTGISDYHKQGKHTTTFPELHILPFGGFIIDTPGIRGFGVIDMDKEEIYHFFPEIFRISKYCRFYNCLHLEEPDCAVRAAVDEKEIDMLRYRSYLNMIENNNSKYR
jgi:ribosome biogenesis GTPase / thiamine phosphate phosphatase